MTINMFNKRIRRMVVTFLIAACVLSQGFSTSYADTSAYDMENLDVEFSSELNKTAQLLISLNIIQATDTFPVNVGEGMSRAEFVKYAMRIKYDSYTSSEISDFEDVDSTSEYTHILALAAENGIVSYDINDPYFRPLDIITYEEALSILFRVCDLDRILDESLPWPQNYVELASKLGLYRSELTIDHDGHMTYEGFLKLMNTMFNAKALERIYGNAVQYKFSDQTYLEKWFDVYKFSGVVTANNVTNLSVSGSYSDGYLLINDTQYYCGNRYQEFLGYQVTGYYREIDERKTIICLYKSGNSECIIDAESIIGLNYDGSNLTIQFENEKGKIEKKIVSNNIAVIYNGKSFSDNKFYAEWFGIEHGTIRLIAAGNGAYTAAFIDEYSSYVVSGVDTKDNVIYLKNSSALNLSGIEKYQISDGERNSVELSDIEKDDIVSLKKAYDNSEITILVSKNYSQGIISSVNKNQAEVSYKDKTYHLLKDTMIKDVSVGQIYRVWIDAFDNIVDFEQLASDELKLGFIPAVKYVAEGFEDIIKIKILLEGGDKPEEFRLAEKVEVDGTRCTGQELKEKNLLFDGHEEPKEYVYYKLNNQGEVSYIDTKRLGDKEDPEKTLHQRYSYNDSGAQLYYKGEGFGTYRSYTNELSILAICGYSVSGCMNVIIPTDESNYNEYATADGGINKQAYYMVDLYTLGRHGLAAVGAAFRGLDAKREITYTDPLYVISDISMTLNADDELVRQLTIVNNGIEKKVFADINSDLIPDDLAIGDAVSAVIDTKGEIKAFQKYFDYKTKKSVVEPETVFGTTIRFVSGQVYDYDETYIGVMTDTNDVFGKDIQVYRAVANTQIYDVIKDKLYYTPMTAESLNTYKNVGDAADIVALKLGYEDMKGQIYYKNTDYHNWEYGNLKASFHEKLGAPAQYTMYSDASGVITLPENMFENDKNIFVGWSDGYGIYQPGEQYTMSDCNVAFYPVWETSYQLSFESGCEDAIGNTPGDIYSLSGETVTLPQNTFSRAGYKFIGWSDGVQTYPAGAQFSVADTNVVFAAQWIESKNITFVGGANTVGDAPVSIGAVPGETVKLPENTFEYNADVKVGAYKFIGWVYDGNIYQPQSDFVMPNEDVQFTASFKYSGGEANIVASDNLWYAFNQNNEYQIDYNTNGGWKYLLSPHADKPYFAEMYLRFDIGDLVHVTTATLAINRSKNGRGGTLNIYDVTDDLDSFVEEKNLTAGSQTYSEPVTGFPQTGNLLYTQRFYSNPAEVREQIDLTEYIKEKADEGKSSVTLKLIYDIGSVSNWQWNGLRIYWPGASGNEPELIIKTSSGI